MSLILPGAPQFSLYESNVGANPSSGPGTSVPWFATPHTKNTSWTQLIASTSFDAQLVVVSIAATSAAATDVATLLDIGIGAAAAETVLIPDLLAGSAAGGNIVGRTYMFPLRVPSGSRVSARCQGAFTSSNFPVHIALYGGPLNPDRWWSGSTVTAYGINTADSGGTAVTAGNSGAETATPVAIGTTTSDHQVIVFGAQIYGTVTTSLQYMYDVGIDVASTSWLARDSFLFATDTSERLWANSMPWLPIWAHVPSGSVLVAGGECSGTAEAAIDVALYGVS